MKIAQLVTQMETGGAQRVCLSISEALETEQYVVENWFLYLKRQSHYDMPNIKVFLPRKPSLLDYVVILSKLWKSISTDPPDVFITHTYYASILGQLMASLCGVSIRIAVQHNPVDSYPALARWLDRFMGSAGFYSYNVAVSQTVMDSLYQYPDSYKERVVKIYNGIPIIKVTESPDIVYAAWNLPEKVPLLINIGRFSHQKNHYTLIRALEKIPEVHLLLIGDGDLRSELKKLVEELNLQKRVHFLGELKPENVVQLLSVASIFVFPSLFEAMPIAAMESMSLGLPIVASDIPALRELIGNAGVLVPATDVDSLARAIQEVLKSPTLMNQMRERSLERSKLFSLEKMVNAYKALFEFRFK